MLGLLVVAAHCSAVMTSEIATQATTTAPALHWHGSARCGTNNSATMVWTLKAR
jgi:hypothetical protein